MLDVDIAIKHRNIYIVSMASILTMVKTKKQITTIQLNKRTKERLDKICKKTETYDDLINRLLNK